MKKINSYLLWVCKIGIMILVPLITGVVFTQVIMRYVFLSPFTWAEEAARYLLVWISCLGAAYGVKNKMHIAVVFIYEKFKGHAKTLVTLLIHFLTIAFFMVCFIKGITLSIGRWNQVSPALRIPMTYPYLAVPVCFGFMIMFGIELFIEDGKRIFSGKSAQEGEAS